MKSDKEKKLERIVKFMSFINNYKGSLRITRNEIYDGDILVGVYKNNSVTLQGEVFKDDIQ